MKIGFIGLGIMGRPMAKNLLKAGYDVTVDSHSPAAAAELEACGAKVADQPTIGSTCDLVLTMLPNAPQVKQVMLGANGVAAHMQPGSTFIDMTSLNPIASKEIAAELAARGIQMLDAPVSGGEPKAIDGTLSFMVGGEEEVFNTFKPSCWPWVLPPCGAAASAQATPPNWPTRSSWRPTSRLWPKP